MKLKVMAVFVAVVVASGCATENTQNPQTNPNATSDAGGETTSRPGPSENVTVINYTDNGFSPGQVTVEEGETVVWVSESSRPMWIGSDRHPVHSQYSGSTLQEHCTNGDQTSSAFDQCSTGDRFTFTFEKTGKWSYHNHRYSTHTGTVTVQ